MSRLIHLLHRPDSNRPLPGDHPRLLAVQIAGIGDLVLATPALDALKDRYPEGRIDLLTSPRAAALLDGHPSLHEIHAFDIGAFRNPARLLNPAVSARLLSSLSPLRARRYDALISLNNISTSRGAFTLGALFAALRVPTWVGRNTDERAPWFDRAINDPSDLQVPEVVTRLQTVALLGADPAPRPLSLVLSNNDRHKAGELLGQGGTWVAVAPAVEDPIRQWPVERFIEVIRTLQEEGCQVAVVGGPDAAPLADAIRLACGEDVLDLAGQLGLLETAAVLERADLVLANNSGPVHLAAAVGTRLVALYDSHHVLRYRPWMEDSRMRVLVGDAGAMPEDHAAWRRWVEASVQRITVAEVLDAVRELLASG